MSFILIILIVGVIIVILAGPTPTMIVMVTSGSVSGQCDELTGQCGCREQVEGRRCQR